MERQARKDKISSAVSRLQGGEDKGARDKGLLLGSSRDGVNNRAGNKTHNARAESANHNSRAESANHGLVSAPRKPSSNIRTVAPAAVSAQPRRSATQQQQQKVHKLDEQDKIHVNSLLRCCSGKSSSGTLATSPTHPPTAAHISSPRDADTNSNVAATAVSSSSRHRPTSSSATISRDKVNHGGVEVWSEHSTISRAARRCPIIRTHSNAGGDDLSDGEEEEEKRSDDGKHHHYSFDDYTNNDTNNDIDFDGEFLSPSVKNNWGRELATLALQELELDRQGSGEGGNFYSSSGYDDGVDVDEEEEEEERKLPPPPAYEKPAVSTLLGLTREDKEGVCHNRVRYQVGEPSSVTADSNPTRDTPSNSFDAMSGSERSCRGRPGIQATSHYTGDDSDPSIRSEAGSSGSSLRAGITHVGVTSRTNAFTRAQSKDDGGEVSIISTAMQRVQLSQAESKTGPRPSPATRDIGRDTHRDRKLGSTAESRVRSHSHSYKRDDTDTHSNADSRHIHETEAGNGISTRSSEVPQTEFLRSGSTSRASVRGSRSMNSTSSGTVRGDSGGNDRGGSSREIISTMTPGVAGAARGDFAKGSSSTSSSTKGGRGIIDSRSAERRERVQQLREKAEMRIAQKQQEQQELAR